MRFSRRAHGRDGDAIRVAELGWPQASFIRFLQRSHAEDGSSWENAGLPSFLEALAVWIDDADGWCSKAGRELPASSSWRFLVRALGAATTYE
ncbi:DUF7660 family protein [Streptomyces mirabilis]